ncbi:MAG: SDR family NAD(P)-dependent oxidoreductase, partial [Actinobacteria bacterium]|nr:SDR family NAD(P)-dependent oxidoreductase [Actinomycetota bacterium]
MGASSGIGRATAVKLARGGARVVVSARDGAALDSLVEEIGEARGRATAVPADVTDPAAVEA